MNKVDTAFSKLGDYLTDTIRRFVSFIFLLFFLGAVFGLVLGSMDPLFLLLPLLAGVLAYYSRAFSIFVLVGFLLVVFL